MMRIYLTEEQCNVGITTLYETISMILNGELKPNYDCRKIKVGDKVEDAIRNFYEREGWGLADINMAWLMFGPKAELEGYAVEVEDDWCDRKSD